MPPIIVEIIAGTKMVTNTTQYNDIDIVIMAGIQKCIRKRLHQFRTDCIADLRPINFDMSNTKSFVNDNQFSHIFLSE